MRAADLQGLCGAGPEIALAQYKQYVLPTLLYGLEAIVLEENNLNKLELYHRRNLRFIQHLPKSTATPAIYLLLGTLPIEAEIDLKILSLFNNIIRPNSDSPPALYIREIILRQLANLDDISSGWTRHVTKILAKYKLPTAYELITVPPKKTQLKQTIKKAITKHWTEVLQEEANTKISLHFLISISCTIGQIHPTWMHINSDLDIKKATIKTQILTQRYPLATSPTAGQCNVACPLCKNDAETTKHFLLLCPATNPDRIPYIAKILQYIKPLSLSIDPDNLTQLILDPSLSFEPDIMYEKLTRNLIFKIHHRRAIILGGGSAYKNLTRKIKR